MQYIGYKIPERRVSIKLFGGFNGAITEKIAVFDPIEIFDPYHLPFTRDATLGPHTAAGWNIEV